MLFGGAMVASPYAFLDETWEWDGTNWQQRTPASRPSPRATSLAYDAARGRVVLFGGTDGPSFLADTWEWDGTNWRQRTPLTTPPARAGHALAYDAQRQRVVMFGGSTTGNSFLADTWEWDGNDWQLLSPAQRPRARSGHAMVYDRARGRVLMFGGSPTVYLPYRPTPLLGDAWEWDGSSWQELAGLSGPGGRFAPGLAYDARRGRAVLYGATFIDGDVRWASVFELTGPSNGTFAVFGSNCSGAQTAPALSAPEGPLVGKPFALFLRRNPADLAWVTVGASAQRFGPLPLPLSLAAIGMPGCALHSSPDLIIPVYPQAFPNLPDLYLPIPPLPQLVGQSFYCQALVRDPTANALGFTVSNAGEARIGMR